MGFEQELRAYVEERDRDAPTDAAVRHVDEHELYRHLVDRLRTLEAAGTPTMVEHLFHEWQNKLARFARHLETLPRQQAPVDPPEAMVFARRTLDVALDCLDADVPLIDRLQAQRAYAGFVIGRAQLEEYGRSLSGRGCSSPRRIRPPKRPARWTAPAPISMSYCSIRSCRAPEAPTPGST